MHEALERCTVRDWRAADAPSLARHANNRNVWLNMRDAFPHPYALADAQRFLALVERQSPRTFFAIEVDGQAAGGIGLSLHGDIERLSAELGYWIAEPFWGRGIATEAIRALTRRAIEHQRLVRVYALPFERNVASWRALESAGYEREGRLVSSAIKDGRLENQLLYAYVARR